MEYVALAILYIPCPNQRNTADIQKCPWPMPLKIGKRPGDNLINPEGWEEKNPT
jgi:hypothetical protein